MFYNEKNNIDELLEEYLIKGGLAESYVYESDIDRIAYIQDVYKTIINRDLIEKYRIYDHEILGLVINAAGMKSNTYEALNFSDLAEEFFVVGDAFKVGNINTATRSGFDAGIQI